MQVREQLREAAEGAAAVEQQLSEREQLVKEVEDRNQQLEKLNRSNENVINWLNKQLAAFKSTENIIGQGQG